MSQNTKCLIMRVVTFFLSNSQLPLDISLQGLSRWTGAKTFDIFFVLNVNLWFGRLMENAPFLCKYWDAINNKSTTFQTGQYFCSWCKLGFSFTCNSSTNVKKWTQKSCKTKCNFYIKTVNSCWMYVGVGIAKALVTVHYKVTIIWCVKLRLKINCIEGKKLYWMSLLVEHH